MIFNTDQLSSMGNASSNASASRSALKQAVASGDLTLLKALVQDSRERATEAAPQPAPRPSDSYDLHALLQWPLNKKGDTALILAVRLGHCHLVPFLLEQGASVNDRNRDGDTALDVLLNGKLLPGNDDILHHHFCPFLHETQDRMGSGLPEPVSVLLRAGARGTSLHRLILHGIKNPRLLAEVADVLCDISEPSCYRLSGLLLQAAVWFYQADNLLRLLRKGVCPSCFWDAPFNPDVVPNSTFSSRPFEIGEDCGEYPVNPEAGGGGGSADQAGLQSLKLTFVQDWRSEWDDGHNPAAQYRAGLTLTPESAIIFVRAANHYHILDLIMADIMKFLPHFCSGPDLRNSGLVGQLLLAGYDFHESQMVHLHLKFLIDFDMFEQFQKQPKPLKHICRTAVRFSFHSNVYCALDHLEYFPKSLKDYVLLRDDFCVSEAEE